MIIEGIKEAFVDFYTAEKLKEKGWNQNTVASYVSSEFAFLMWYNPDKGETDHKILHNGDFIDPNDRTMPNCEVVNGDCVAAPTHGMVLEWFRRNGIYIYVEPCIVTGIFMERAVVKYFSKRYSSIATFALFEGRDFKRATEKAILYVLDNFKLENVL